VLPFRRSIFGRLSSFQLAARTSIELWLVSVFGLLTYLALNVITPIKVAWDLIRTGIAGQARALQFWIPIASFLSLRRVFSGGALRLEAASLCRRSWMVFCISINPSSSPLPSVQRMPSSSRMGRHLSPLLKTVSVNFEAYTSGRYSA
jgi:hypothetical protein